MSGAKVRPSCTKKKPMYTIPLRATLLSAALFIGILIGGVLSLEVFKLRKEDANAVSTIISASINALRCPLMVALTFSAKVRADLQNREKRQEQVRRWAQQEREKRRVILPMNVLVV